MTDNPQVAWLRDRIADLERDAATVEEGESNTGLTLEEENLLSQYRFELASLESS